MRHPSFASGCGVCAMLEDRSEPIVFENGLWQVRHIGPPHAIAGWMMLVTRRHVDGPAHFDDAEAESFGPTLRHFERVLLEVTGALRIYMAALGESSPHFHAHMVPRYASMPKDAKAWGVFDLQRAAAAGEIEVDPADVRRMVDRYAERIALYPPPAPPARG